MPSLTQLKEILRECAFDPRDTVGPNRVIVDTALENVDYLDSRARELIVQAKNVLDQKASNPNEAAVLLDEYKRRMKQAIGLLALSIAIRD